MPPARPGDDADDQELTDYRPSNEGWAQLPTVLAGMFPSPQTSIEFLQRDVAIPRDQVRDFSPSQTTATEYWQKILILFDSPEFAKLRPYERLYNALRERREFHEHFDVIFGDYDPPVTGCHVILVTRDKEKRNFMRDWLAREGLEPTLIWSAHGMTSFGVNEPREDRVRSLVRSRYDRALVKVILPGQSDWLIDPLRVVDGNDVVMSVPEVPEQLTVFQLGAAAARFHPAEQSAIHRVSGESRAEVALRVGGGVDGQDSLDSTLLQCLLQENEIVTIQSLKYHEIRVAFVSSSPNWKGVSRLSEGRVRKELDLIQAQAKLRHIKIVGAVTNATPDHMTEIMSLEPDILHIACHGEDGNLFWEDDHQNPECVSPKWLANCITMRTMRQDRRLSGIVLSACAGETIGPLLTAAARDVIAHQGPLLDEVACDFTKRFYTELSRTPVLRTAAELAGKNVQVFPLGSQGGWY